MATKAQTAAQEKYDRIHTQAVMMKLNRTSDADILAYLETMENRQGYIKDLIRADIRTGQKVLPIDSIALLIRPAALKYLFERVYLFGSYARNEAREDSDIDLLVEGGSLVDFGTYQAAVDMISNATGKKVDLVTVSSLQEDDSRSGRRFREHIERDRVLIYERTA